MTDQEFQNLSKKFEQERQEKAKTVKEEMYASLPENIHRIEVEYDGSGDSGCINDVRFFGENNEPLDDPAEKIVNKVEEYIYDMLPGGWEINDGSYGTAVISVKEKTCKVEHNERYTDYNTSEIID